MSQSENKKIIAKTAREFIEKVAEDCYANLTDEQKETIYDNPNALDYHFGYCMYIRNNYIYNNVDNMDFEFEPDDLSGAIMRVLIKKITGDDPDDLFQYRLYSHKEYLKLRKCYRKLYGKDAKELTEKYRDRYPTEDEDLEVILHVMGLPANIPEDNGDHADQEGNDPIIKKEKVAKDLIMELAELVWRTDKIREVALSHGVEEKLIAEKIQGVRDKLISERIYIPMGSCLLSFRDQIGEEIYDQYREELIIELDEDPYLMKSLDLKLFHDRELAKAVLKHPFAMGLLKEYQDDDEMVRYALECDGEAIQYVDERYINDREWVRFAIEHTDSHIMRLDCLKRYRGDKEIVYLACKKSSINFCDVDEPFHDDYDLVHMILSSYNYSYSIISELSDRLKDDVSIAILAATKCRLEGFDMNSFSDRIRDNEEVAEAIIKYKGLDSWAMYQMSDRIKEKYGFDFE